MIKTYYDILGIKNDVSEKEVKKAYWKMITKYHPDNNQNISSEKIALMHGIACEINEAWEVLRDNKKREKYDFELKDKEFNSNLKEDIFKRSNNYKKDPVGFKNTNFEDFINNFWDFMEEDDIFSDIREKYKDEQEEKTKRSFWGFNSKNQDPFTAEEMIFDFYKYEKPREWLSDLQKKQNLNVAEGIIYSALGTGVGYLINIIHNGNLIISSLFGNSYYGSSIERFGQNLTLGILFGTSLAITNYLISKKNEKKNKKQRSLELYVNPLRN
ncbi:MAG: DnaJ domain-containing protein [Nanoarchaeota archaeon]|nr:DnaJ domain-containing protein [Nanoarchaeota archaeon]